MDYETIALAYRDLEPATGRLALIARLAELVRDTPDDELASVCYLCQGQIAPEFAGVDLGVAEKLAVRAVAARRRQPTATRSPPPSREAGDLGEAAERLLPERRAPSPDRGCRCVRWWTPCCEIAAAAGTGSQGRKLDLLAGLLTRATPLEARYLLRLVTGNLRLGIGTPTILDALAEVHAGGARQTAGAGAGVQHLLRPRPGRGRRWSRGGLAAVEQMRVRAGQPGPGDAGPAAVRGRRDPRRSSAARCAAEYKYDGMRVQAHRTADGRDRAVHPPAGAGQRPVPRRGRAAATPGSGRRRRSSRARWSPTTRRPASCARSREVMFRRRKHGIAEAARDVPVGLFCFELLYADGEDLTRLPYPQRRARLAEAVTLSDRLRLTTAVEVSDARPRWTPSSSRRSPTAAEGLVCKAVGAGLRLPGRRPRAGPGSSSSATTAPSWPTPSTWSSSARSTGRGRRHGSYGAVLLAAYDPEAELFRTVGKLRRRASPTPSSPALPERLAPFRRSDRAATGRLAGAGRRLVRARPW